MHIEAWAVQCLVSMMCYFGYLGTPHPRFAKGLGQKETLATRAGPPAWPSKIVLPARCACLPLTCPTGEADGGRGGRAQAGALHAGHRPVGGHADAPGCAPWRSLQPAPAIRMSSPGRAPCAALPWPHTHVNERLGHDKLFGSCQQHTVFGRCPILLSEVPGGRVTGLWQTAEQNRVLEAQCTS